MHYNFVITISVFVAIFVLILVAMKIRIRLNKKSEEIDDEIKQAFEGVADVFHNTTTNSFKQDDRVCESIEELLEHCFVNRFITKREERKFSNQLRDMYDKAISLQKQISLFRIQQPTLMLNLIENYISINWYVKRHNEKVIAERLEGYKEFFDHCLAYPLDEQQRRAIVSEEENCLVVSSAGSGKTSSIVGKVKYLTECRGVSPQHILLISYTNKAAAELTERMGIAGIRGYTFHKLALDIIGKVTGEKPSICENTDALFINIYNELLSDKKFQQAVVEYFVDYQIEETELEKKKREHQENLRDQKNTRLKALLPDMDGNEIYVKSAQEQKICFALSSLGVKFRYEEPYEHRLANEMHSQYKPDFSIYYEEKGKQKRIYLEHFGVDEHGLVPLWFAKDRGITYEEANKQYGDGITWKQEAHKKYGTTLVSTTSADFHYFDIRTKLEKLLNDVGVPTKEKTDEELYSMLLQKGSKQEKAFIRLTVTFITLLKSRCSTIDEILRTVNDKRSEFIIKRIIKPISERYEESLKQNRQIDFTDAILWATKLCMTHKSVSYDYIIVDEFQDISIDRYKFLKALRNGGTPAKLYCVGDDWQSIYRFSGSDMALFNQFPDFFGDTEINKIETTYRFGEPLVGISSHFIQQNKAQISKNIRPFNQQLKTDISFHAYERNNYCNEIAQIVSCIPTDKSIFLLGRYSFDDYYLSFMYKSIKEHDRFYYVINGRKIEFLTAHKSKGLEADYVIILQCNRDLYGFPSMISDDPVLNYVLTKSDRYPYGEERRLFYVAITRAKVKTVVMYDHRYPSVFVDEFIHPEKVTEENYAKHRNANKVWTRGEDGLLYRLYQEGKSIRYISQKMGRSQTSIIMRLGKLGIELS